MVIIGDTSDEDVHKVLPVERTKALLDNIKIPSILIQKEDAENISKILGSQSLSMAIHFPLIKTTDVANIRMILQVDDLRSYDSILALASYKNIFESVMELTIHYKVFKNIDI